MRSDPTILRCPYCRSIDFKNDETARQLQMEDYSFLRCGKCGRRYRVYTYRGYQCERTTQIDLNNAVKQVIERNNMIVDRVRVTE